MQCVSTVTDGWPKATLNLNWNDYGARWYDPQVARWWSVDPLADHPNQLGNSPYIYAVDNPILHNDPSGKCPPWICGAIAGGTTEIAYQYLVNIYNGQGYFEAAENIDMADVTVATIDGAITGGGSAVRRAVIGATKMIVGEVVEASVDIELGGDVDYIGKEGSDKSIGQITQDTAVGIGSNIVGKSTELGVGTVLNNKAINELSTVNKELKKSMKGSSGETDRLTKKKSLQKQISGNENAAGKLGDGITESLDNKYKN